MYDKLISVGVILCVGALVLMLAARVSGNLGLCLLGVLLFGMMALVISLADNLRRKENEKNPITTVEATVVGHRMETYHGRYSTSQSFYITFKPEDGSDALEFKVSEAEYQDFGVGDKGPLRYRTWEYLSFCAKDMSEVEPLSRLPKEYDPDVKEAAENSGWDQAEKSLDTATEKAGEFWKKVKDCCGEMRKAKSVQRDEAAEKDTGILTHELDE